jgi:hypothetical protein
MQKKFLPDESNDDGEEEEEEVEEEVEASVWYTELAMWLL